MDNRINQLSIGSTHDRTAVKTDFGMMLARGIAQGTCTVAGVASSIIPGGAVISAAVNRTANTALSGGPRSGAAAAYGGGTVPNIPTASSGSGVVGAGGLDASGISQQINADHQSNIQYIELQRQMQAESQFFTSISNIMKVRHETSKTAINNIR